MDSSTSYVLKFSCVIDTVIRGRFAYHANGRVVFERRVVEIRAIVGLEDYDTFPL